MDLGAVLDRTGTQITTALATSGCAVNLRVPVDPAGGTADPATLTVAPAPNPPYASAVPAVLTEKPARGDGQPARPAAGVAATVVVGPGVVVEDRTEVVVAASRDPHLLGRVYAVTGVRGSFAGVCRILDVEQVRGS